jgi:hypothetical protein
MAMAWSPWPTRGSGGGRSCGLSCDAADTGLDPVNRRPGERGNPTVRQRWRFGQQWLGRVPPSRRAPRVARGSGCGRARELRPFRAPAALFVVAPPSGCRIRTRLRVPPADAAVLRAAGEHLGAPAGADLAVRVRIGSAPAVSARRAERKKALTAQSSSRCGRGDHSHIEDQYQLGRRALNARIGSGPYGADSSGQDDAQHHTHGASDASAPARKAPAPRRHHRSGPSVPDRQLALFGMCDGPTPAD